MPVIRHQRSSTDPVEMPAAIGYALFILLFILVNFADISDQTKAKRATRSAADTELILDKEYS